MNTFFTQDFFVIIGFIILLLFVAILIIDKRETASDKRDKIEQAIQAEKIQTEERKEWGKINSKLKTAFSPELKLETNESPRYRVRKDFLSPTEQIFFKLLCEAAEGSYQVFAKTRVADVFSLANNPIDRKFYNNNIRCRHFDYLLCEGSTQRLLITEPKACLYSYA